MSLSLPLHPFLRKQIPFLQSQERVNDTNWANHSILAFELWDTSMDKPVQSDSTWFLHPFTKAGRNTSYSSLIMKDWKSMDLTAELLVVLFSPKWRKLSLDRPCGSYEWDICQHEIQRRRVRTRARERKGKT